jgi:hypothetical protein
MFRYLRLSRQPEKPLSEPGTLTGEYLARDAELPLMIFQVNSLPENTKRRIYRSLIPPSLLSIQGIDPITWKSSAGGSVSLKADPGTNLVRLSARKRPEDAEDYFCLELADNVNNGIDLNLILLNDPDSPYFGINYDDSGQPTMFGTLRRNLREEERAMLAGLAPGQSRSSLGASKTVFSHLDNFLSVLGHRAYFLEPLTYASAWIFERRGFAYVRGHKLMDDIHAHFQPGGILTRALDCSTPFRQPEQAQSVRGRAWAIQDGILDAIGERWDKLRMVKQIGRHTGVETTPGLAY